MGRVYMKTTSHYNTTLSIQPTTTPSPISHFHGNYGNHNYTLPTLTCKSQLATNHGGIAPVPAKVTDGAPPPVHLDLYSPIGVGSAIDESDGYLVLAIGADDARVFPVATVVHAPGVGSTVAEEALVAHTTHVIQPDLLRAHSYEERKGVICVYRYVHNMYPIRIMVKGENRKGRRQ